MHNVILNGEMRDRKGETVCIWKMRKREKQHDSQILQVSVMWFLKWRIHPNHKKVLLKFLLPKKILSYFLKVYITIAFTDTSTKSTLQFPGRNQINFTLFPCVLLEVFP